MTTLQWMFLQNTTIHYKITLQKNKTGISHMFIGLYSLVIWVEFWFFDIKFTLLLKLSYYIINCRINKNGVFLHLRSWLKLFSWPNDLFFVQNVLKRMAFLISVFRLDPVLLLHILTSLMELHWFLALPRRTILRPLEKISVKQSREHFLSGGGTMFQEEFCNRKLNEKRIFLNIINQNE